MERISGGNFVDIAAAIVIDVLSCRDRGLKRVFILKATESTKYVDLVFTYGVDDLAC